MKKTKFLTSLSLGLMIVGVGAALAFAPHGEVHIAQAMPGEAVGLVGTFNKSDGTGSQNWNTDDPIPFSFVDDHWELEITLKEGDQFKAYSYGTVGGGRWVECDQGALPSEYFYIASNNWNVLVDGTYLLKIKDNFTFTGGGATEGIYNAWAGAEKVVKETATVTIMNGEEVVRVDETNVGEVYTTSFVHVEDYYFDGLYADKELSESLGASFVVEGDMVVYGKFTPVDVDDLYVFYTGSEYSNIHFWGDDYGTNWPGLPLVNVSGTDVYYYAIPAEYRATNVILNDGGSLQTEDILLLEGYRYQIVSGNAIDAEQTSALCAFVDAFKLAREEGGIRGICDLTADSDVVVKYLALAEDTKALLEALKDTEGYTIYDTMAYVISRTSTAQGNNGLLANENKNYVIIVVTVAILSVSIIGAFAFLTYKRKQKQ